MITRMLPMALIAAATAVPAIAQNQAAQQQPVTKTAFMSQIDGAFAAIDTNKDGFTDRTELEAAQNKTMAARKTQVLKGRENAFNELDKDKNGSLTLAEFNAVVAAQPIPKANVAPFLQRLDTNKDGKISSAENRAVAVGQFDKADTNKDGSLSVAERQKAGNQ